MTAHEKDSGSQDTQGTDAMYRASWIDLLVRWIDRAPGRAGWVYAGGLVVLAIVGNAVFWVDGSLAPGQFDRVRLTEAVYVLFFPALYHHLKLVAGRSFRTFQPLLRRSKGDLAALEYRITSLPQGLGWLAAALGVVLAVVSISTGAAAFGLDRARTAVPAAYQYATTSFAFAAVFAVVMQTIRQLRLVSQIHREAKDISLFQLEPVHAMASLTARAGIGLALFVLFNGIAESAAITELNLAFLVAMALLAGVVFVAPLVGMRGRLRQEKARMLGETSAAIQVTISRVHDRVNDDKYKDISELNTTLNALVVEKALIERISIWPWDVSTVRGFASSVLLPILLVVVARLLENLV
jgi:hypothetical protein